MDEIKILEMLGTGVFSGGGIVGGFLLFRYLDRLVIRKNCSTEVPALCAFEDQARKSHDSIAKSLSKLAEVQVRQTTILEDMRGDLKDVSRQATDMKVELVKLKK